MTNALAISEKQGEFTPQQRQALQTLGIGAVAPGDLQIFLHECQKTGLDPFQKQIYLIRRGDKSTIQVGIDGLQTIARRTVTKTGEAFGEAPILWCGTDGVWRDIWLPLQAPAAAKAVVKRGEGTFTAVALFREFAPMYNGKLSGLWAKMPAHMIGKVAMAHALRQAFPAEMSGVYTDDEMAQAGPAAPVQVQAKQQTQQPAPRVQAPAQPVQPQPVQPQRPRRQAPTPAAAPTAPAPRVQASQPAPKQAPAQPVTPTTGGDPWAANMTAAPAKKPTAADKQKDAEWLKGLEQARQELAEKREQAKEQAK